MLDSDSVKWGPDPKHFAPGSGSTWRMAIRISMEGGDPDPGGQKTQKYNWYLKGDRAEGAPEKIKIKFFKNTRTGTYCFCS